MAFASAQVQTEQPTDGTMVGTINIPGRVDLYLVVRIFTWCFYWKIV
jgi:hypothetical protein